MNITERSNIRERKSSNQTYPDHLRRTTTNGKGNHHHHHHQHYLANNPFRSRRTLFVRPGSSPHGGRGGSRHWLENPCVFVSAIVMILGTFLLLHTILPKHNADHRQPRNSLPLSLGLRGSTTMKRSAPHYQKKNPIEQGRTRVIHPLMVGVYMSVDHDEERGEETENNSAHKKQRYPIYTIERIRIPKEIHKRKKLTNEEENDSDNFGGSDDDVDECDVIPEWATETHPNCNAVHEIEMADVEYINSGSSRSTWVIWDFDPKEVTLKTLRYEKDIDYTPLDSNLQDVRIMERLTSSPYVANVFSYCGASQITEYGTQNLHDLIKTARLEDGKDRISSSDKLRIAVQMARGLADLHNSDKNGIPSIAHNDYCCHQLILVDGVYKINDFNLSTVMGKQRETNTPCLSYSEWHEKLRPPEVYEAEETESLLRLDKIDVYMLGNVLYYLLTSMWLFEGIDSDTAHEKLKQGVRSPFPPAIANSNDPAVRAIRRAIEKCWTHDVESRPDSKDISEYLENKLELLLNLNPKSEVVRVKIPPLRENHRHTDSDFYSNFY